MATDQRHHAFTRNASFFLLLSHALVTNPINAYVLPSIRTSERAGRPVFSSSRRSLTQLSMAGSDNAEKSPFSNPMKSLKSFLPTKPESNDDDEKIQTSSKKALAPVSTTESDSTNKLSFTNPLDSLKSILPPKPESNAEVIAEQPPAPVSTVSVNESEKSLFTNPFKSLKSFLPTESDDDSNVSPSPQEPPTTVSTAATVNEDKSTSSNPIESLKSFVPSMPESKDDDDKFSFAQRIESLKSVVVGALAGGTVATPFIAIHDIAFGGNAIPNGVAQWEFDTDMGSLEAALFAIVYRYAIRTDDNPMLNQGVIGAFVLTRSLSRVQVPNYCTAAPLTCGAPLEYFDWSMLSQLVFSGIESVALFGGAAAAMEYCFNRNFISKFK